MTTVRDLLDVAAAELGETSRRISADHLYGPTAAASGWCLLLPAAQHLTVQTVGPWSKVNARLVRNIGALVAPQPNRDRAPTSSVQRAATAMGAAGDLLSTRIRTGSVVERNGLLGEALHLLAASAEVTLHGIGHDLSHSATIESAAQAGRLAREFAVQTRLAVDGPLSFTAVPAPALPRSHPGGALAEAVHTWSELALHLGDRTAVSSQDLRGTAVVAAHLLGCVQRLHSFGPPDATAAPSDALQRWVRQWQQVEGLLQRLVIAGPTHVDLARASWDVVAQVKPVVAQIDGAAAPFSPWARSALSRRVVDVVAAVAHRHSRIVTEAISNEHVLVHTNRATRAVRRPHETTRAEWLPASPDEARPLLLAYSRLMTTRDPRSAAVGRARPAASSLVPPRPTKRSAAPRR